MIVKVVAKSIVQRSDGKVLVLRRSQTDTRRPGGFDLPGGGVEVGEDVLFAAAREIQEEAGLAVSVSAMKILHALTTREPHGATIRLLCYAHVESDEVTLSFEHDKYWWMTVDEVIAAFDSRDWGKNIEFARSLGLLS